MMSNWRRSSGSFPSLSALLSIFRVNWHCIFFQPCFEPAKRRHGERGRDEHPSQSRQGSEKHQILKAKTRMSLVCLYQKKKHSAASKEHNKISTKASNLAIKFKVSLQSLENQSYIVLCIAKAYCFCCENKCVTLGRAILIEAKFKK